MDFDLNKCFNCSDDVVEELIKKYKEELLEKCEDTDNKHKSEINVLVENIRKKYYKLKNEEYENYGNIHLLPYIKVKETVDKKYKVVGGLNCDLETELSGVEHDTPGKAINEFKKYVDYWLHQFIE